MLTLYEFLDLPLVERSKYITQKCTFLICRKDGRQVNHSLYYAKAYFIEVQFDDNRKELVRIRPFTKSCYLEPYLEDVDLRQILE
jgi:hypothetical protein